MERRDSVALRKVFESAGAGDAVVVVKRCWEAGGVWRAEGERKAAGRADL